MNCLAQKKNFRKKIPVWSDPDDPSQPSEPTRIEDEDQEKEKNDHEKDEAQHSSSDEDDELYANDVRARKATLEAKILKFKHLVNINNERSYTGAVQQVQFNPKSRIALVSLSKGQTDLFEVDGERNRYLQNIKLPRTARPFCSFTTDGERIVITSDTYKGTFYIYDMISGSTKSYSLKLGTTPQEMTDFRLNETFMVSRKEGSQEILCLSPKTFESVLSIKLNENVKAIRFLSDHDILALGERSKVYVWDLRKHSRCKHKFHDEGTIHTTSLSVSDRSRSLAIGSDMGIVNMYDLDQCLAQKFPQPFKTLSNLEKNVNLLDHNGTGELLLAGASEDTAAFRLIHTLTGTVYQNFPQEGKKYGRIFSADFSPLSGYLALGSSSGRAFLCRLSYFSSY